MGPAAAPIGMRMVIPAIPRMRAIGSDIDPEDAHGRICSADSSVNLCIAPPLR